MSFTFHLRADAALADIAEIHDKLANSAQRRGMMKVIGVRAERMLRDWFMKRDASSPNKHGWPRQHFWSRIRERTAWDPEKTTETQATVVVADPALAAKISGATIKPTGAVSPATGKPTQNISIPLVGAVYGAWPRGNPVPGLFFIPKRGGKGGYLVTRDAQSKQLTFFYRLLPEVTVPKDPQALPPANQVGVELGQAALTFFLRQGEIGGSN